MQVLNANPEPVKIHQGTRLGVSTPSHAICTVTEEGTSPETTLPESLNIDLDSSNLSSVQIQELKRSLVSFSDLFASPTGALGRTSVVKHAIQTDGPPVKQQLRRMPEALKAAVKEEVQKMLNQGVVRPSSSPWSSPTVLVKKKNGAWRFCVDYRKVNSMTRRDAYPLPRIDATLDALAGAQYFTTLDLASGYWQVELEEDAKKKTAFSTPFGHYEFNVMPFGLTNAPPTFQRLMDCVLAGISPEQCLIYLDDIIVFSQTFQEHLQRLSNVLKEIRKAGLKLQGSKCKFACKEVHYLGYIVSQGGISPDPDKLRAVSAFPAPSNEKQLREFLGLSNYYRRFVKNYSQIAEPLYKLTKKNTKGFQWDAACQQAFDDLKQRLTSPPILTYPVFTLPFIVHADASERAIGGVLSQVQEGEERVIGYWSRQLNKAERNYSTVEREALAVVAAVKEFYPYLYGFHFTLVTDHNPLTSLKGLNDVHGRLTRWIPSYNSLTFSLSIGPGESMVMQMHFLGGRPKSLRYWL